MENSFIEMLTFQVRPDRTEQFESLLPSLKAELANQPGCIDIRCFKRFYTFDGIEHGEPPRELTRITKCVKYYAYWEFDSIESCGKACGWLLKNRSKEISKLLIMPFEINSGYSL